MLLPESRGIQEIDKAFEEIQNKSCLKFVQRTDQDRFIKFYKGEYCGSPVGAVEDHQKVFQIVEIKLNTNFT